MKVLLIVAALGITLVTGIGLAIYFAITDPTSSPSAEAGGPAPERATSTEQLRDQIAGAPMVQVNPADATSGTPTLDVLPEMAMPPATRIGAAGIPSGYPQTGEGAAAQLGEIVVSVLEPMDLDHARQVGQEWFEQPDDTQQWPLMWVIQEFLRAGRLSNGLPVGASVRVEPVGAQIKGSDGQGWHVACVLVQVTYTYVGQAELAYGHCERMTWIDGRWVIGVGEHPVPAPSTWPGTDVAIAAGWLTWRQG